MQQTIDKIILKNLLKTNEFTKKTLPFLKPEYFLDPDDRLLFEAISDFIEQYDTVPTFDALEAEIDTLKIGEKQVESIKNTIKDISQDTNQTSYHWLVTNTEKFCKQKAIYNGIMQSIDILSGKSQLQEEAIEDILKDAMRITFDPNVGLDFLETFDDRYKYYQSVEEKIPFDLDFFNRITKNGVSRGTLNVILAGTGVGKSLVMCHFAAAALAQGKNVLYITLELSEKEVAKRIDANLMNTALDDLINLPEMTYLQKANILKAKTNGKLIIKQYPTASAGTHHFKSLVHELSLKKNFKPDIIFIDYLNICASSRIKRGKADSYEYVKAIAEEVRGLGVELDIPIWSATQTNRSGYQSTDVGLEDTSESFGLPATADFMFALISTDELEKLGQLMVKQLKNRYGDVNINKRFVVGIDRSKMKLYDAEESAQQGLTDANQQAIKSVTINNPGSGYQAKPTINPNRQGFKGLKVTA